MKIVYVLTKSCQVFDVTYADGQENILYTKDFLEIIKISGPRELFSGTGLMWNQCNSQGQDGLPGLSFAAFAALIIILSPLRAQRNSAKVGFRRFFCSNAGVMPGSVIMDGPSSCSICSDSLIAESSKRCLDGLSVGSPYLTAILK